MAIARGPTRSEVCSHVLQSLARLQQQEQGIGTVRRADVIVEEQGDPKYCRSQQTCYSLPAEAQQQRGCQQERPECISIGQTQAGRNRRQDRRSQPVPRCGMSPIALALPIDQQCDKRETGKQRSQNKVQFKAPDEVLPLAGEEEAESSYAKPGAPQCSAPAAQSSASPIPALPNAVVARRICRRAGTPGERGKTAGPPPEKSSEWACGVPGADATTTPATSDSSRLPERRSASSLLQRAARNN